MRTMESGPRSTPGPIPAEMETRSPTSVWSPISIHASPKIAPWGKDRHVPSPRWRNRYPAGVLGVTAPVARIAAQKRWIRPPNIRRSASRGDITGKVTPWLGCWERTPGGCSGTSQASFDILRARGHAVARRDGHDHNGPRETLLAQRRKHQASVRHRRRCLQSRQRAHSLKPGAPSEASRPAGHHAEAGPLPQRRPRDDEPVPAR